MSAGDQENRAGGCFGRQERDDPQKDAHGPQMVRISICPQTSSRKDMLLPDNAHSTHHLGETLFSSRKISYSGRMAPIAARNFFRRSRLISIPRSCAWSDFFQTQPRGPHQISDLSPATLDMGMTGQFRLISANVRSGLARTHFRSAPSP